MPRGGSDTDGVTDATARLDREPVSSAVRWHREPQVAALKAFAVWAAAGGVSAGIGAELDRLIDLFAADPQAPNLELAMRRARRDLVREGLPYADDPR